MSRGSSEVRGVSIGLPAVAPPAQRLQIVRSVSTTL